MAASQSPSRDTHTTTILLSNIHCPSCVRTIEDTLRHYHEQVLDISTSTVTQTVTIKHTKDVAASTLATALYNAGFDVQSMWEQRGGQRISTFATSMLTPASPNHNEKRTTHSFLDFSCGLIQTPDQRQQHDAMHSAYCEQCAAEGPVTGDDDRALLTQPVEVYDDKMPNDHVGVLSTQPIEQQKFKVVIAVHGMTCSACVGRVAEVLEAKPYVEDVSVNLIGHSATLHITDAEKTSELVEEVEDIGYDATLESCGPVATRSRQATDEASTRTVTIKIDGIHCQHCPGKIVQVLKDKLTDCAIVSGPAMDGLITLSYTPQPPGFTIRSILECIKTADPAFSASVFRPPSLEERARKLQARHQRRIAIRLGVSVIMAVPTLVLGVVIMNLLSPDNSLRQYWMSPTVGQTPRVLWPLLAFATVVYLFAADIFHRRAIKEVYMMWRRSSKVPVSRRLYRFGSMDMLLSLGTSVAYFGSIVILIISSLQKEPAMSNDIDTTTYFDAVVFLTMFLLAGRLLEAYGKAQTADAVSSLGKLRPAEALLICDPAKGEGAHLTQTVSVDNIESGDIIMVPAGGSPACDGTIHRGTTTLNESSLTGEARPVSRTVGDDVFAGTVNITNAIQVRVTGVAGGSLLDRIIDTVREGQAKRAPIERIADVLTGYFVPAIIAIALLDWIIWLSLGYSRKIPYVDVGTGGWVFWSLQFAIAVLVVACPCGIGLAAPTALFVGTGLAAKQGILVKGGGEAFQEASALDCVVFDKTGTITEGGSPQITDSHFFAEHSKPFLMAALNALESASSHPLAKAVVSFCNMQESTATAELQSTEEISGKGMNGRFDTNDGTTELFIGNRSMVEDHGVTMSAEASFVFDKWCSEGKTVMLVGSRVSDKPFTLDLMLAASDAIRPEAARVIAALQAQGTDVWLLSGDNQTTAEVVATNVGIPAGHVIAGVLPHEKAAKVQYLQRTSHRKGWSSEKRSRASVAMVGDGINDAPALATADVGIAMGSGSDTAISTASFVLLSSDLDAVLTLLKLSKAVIRRVKFNFGWALAYNLLMLPIAAGVLFPAVSNGSHIRLDPVWASLAMALSSVSVVTSSLLLKTGLPVVGFRY